MAKGVKTGGRKKGVPNKASIARAAAIAASGLTPLDFLLSVMRDDQKALEDRLEAGKAAAPYVHPRLANIEVAGKDGGPLEVRIVRFSDRVAQPLGTQKLPAQGVERPGGRVSPDGAVLAPSQRQG